MTELDDALRASFARIAEPGDPAGVVDAMRARMAAGDTGTPAATSGFGSSAGWVIRWTIGGAVLAIGGLVLGMSGLLPSPFAPQQTAGATVLQSTADVLDCPGGSPVGTLAAGSRVLAVARSDDGAYLEIRSPYDTSSSVWLSSVQLIVDDAQTPVSALPVGACPVSQTTEVEPTATPPTQQPTDEPLPQPTAGPSQGPTPPADTVAPSIQAASANPTTFYNDDATLLTVQASDNVGVTSVTVQFSGAYTGSGVLTKSGSVWQLSFSLVSGQNEGAITATFRAVDAAGNQSAPTPIAINHAYFG
jgi:hypothetical protein